MITKTKRIFYFYSNWDVCIFIQKFETEGHRLYAHSKMRLGSNLRSESSKHRQMEIPIAVVKLVGAHCKEILVQIKRFVDSWAEKTFIWTLANIAHG